MNSAQAISVLREHEPELQKRGVQHIALFGSFARGEARTGSDIDLMVDLQPDAQISMFDDVDLVEYVQGLLGSRWTWQTAKC